MELRIVKKRKSKLKRIGTIRAWKFQDEAVASEFKEGVLEKKSRGVADQGLNERWSNMKDIIVCDRGRTRRPKGREEWRWSDEVTEAVKKKKVAFIEMNNKRGDVEVENRYNEAKKQQTKKAVTRAKAEASKGWCEELETKEGQQKFLG